MDVPTAESVIILQIVSLREPGSNGVDCSQKTAYEVEQLMAEKLSEYSIEVSSRNIAAQTIRGEDIDYQYMSTGEILQLLKKQNTI